MSLSTTFNSSVQTEAPPETEGFGLVATTLAGRDGNLRWVGWCV